MPESDSAPWKILIVDDEPEVHTVTKMVLNQYEFSGRKLQFYDAYSAAEAKEVFIQYNDIAVILLDVIMEEEDSGLKLVSFIRDECKNSLVRIILRTGQPGQVPEHKVVLDYDINDYKTKNDLTYQKLTTSITAALRSYEVIKSLDSSSRELAREKEVLSATLHSIEDAVITVDKDGNITLLNDVAERIAGVPLVSVIGKSFCSHISLKTKEDGTEIECPVKTCLHTRQAVIMNDPALFTHTKSKNEILITYTGAPIISPAGELLGAVIIARDVTARIRMEEEMRKIQKLESIGILAGGIAHDFNNILTGIMGNISLAKLDTSREKKGYAYLNDAEKAIMRAQTLTRQLLSFAKGSAPVKETLDSRMVINEAVSVFQSSHYAKLDIDLPEELPWINADKGQISQVIGNILLNAFHATASGGIIAVRASLYAHHSSHELGLKEGNYLKISVTDTGEGIEETNLSRIFDPFFTTKSNGNGLGLTTSFTIIKRHGGIITVTSQKGKGSEFCIIIPSCDIPGTETKHENTGAEKNGSRISVLLMDDDEFIIKSVSSILTYMGFETDTAHDGDEAAAKYKAKFDANTPYDVVIMDLTIQGGTGGKDAIKMVLAIDPNAKALVSSGYSEDPVMAEYKAYGFKGVVLKPYKPQDLADAIRKTAALR